MCFWMMDATQNKTHSLLDAIPIFILGEFVTGISGSKVMICIGNSGSIPERAPCR